MIVNREREMILTEQESFDVVGSTLAQVAAMVAQAIATYGETAVIDEYTPPYSDSSYLYIWTQVPETDRAMADRISRCEKYAAMSLASDRQEYERLKAKFG